jgi:hypothetical protein
MPTPDQTNLLLQARDKTAALLMSVERDAAELGQTPVKLSPEVTAQGQSACGGVVDAVRKILDNLERSLSDR